MTGALDEHTSALLAAVEQQLTRYFASISRQVDAQKVATTEAIGAQRLANEQYQEALRSALEDRLNAFAQYQHERLVAMEEHLDHTAAALAAPAAPAVDLGTVIGRIETNERHLVDRMVELERRLNDEQGRRIAELEAVVGRIGAGFDEAIGALSQRLQQLDDQVADLRLLTDDLATRNAPIDPRVIDDLRQQISATAGDAALTRVELDRLTATATKHFDHQAARLADMESRLSAPLDVNTAVQLERLDEIERQLSALDPTGPLPRPTLPAELDEPGAAATTVEPVPVFEVPSFEVPSFDTPSAVPSEVDPFAARADSELLADPISAEHLIAPAASSFTPQPDEVHEPAHVARVVHLPPLTEPTTAAAASDDAAPAPTPPTLTRRVTAPPPMTLVPRLPAAPSTLDPLDPLGSQHDDPFGAA